MWSILPMVVPVYPLDGTVMVVKAVKIDTTSEHFKHWYFSGIELYTLCFSLLLGLIIYLGSSLTPSTAGLPAIGWGIINYLKQTSKGDRQKKSTSQIIRVNFTPSGAMQKYLYLTGVFAHDVCYTVVKLFSLSTCFEHYLKKCHIRL